MPTYLRFICNRFETSVQMEIAPVNPRFLAVAPKTIATACLATSLSPLRYWTASPRKEKLAHAVLELNHLRLSPDFYLISAHKYAQKNFQNFFSVTYQTFFAQRRWKDPWRIIITYPWFRTGTTSVMSLFVTSFRVSTATTTGRVGHDSENVTTVFYSLGLLYEPYHRQR